MQVTANLKEKKRVQEVEECEEYEEKKPENTYQKREGKREST